MQEDESVESRLRGSMRWGYGKLIRRIDDNRWVAANSAEGQAILKEVFVPNANGERPSYCWPR